jgi:hypothetical protein
MLVKALGQTQIRSISSGGAGIDYDIHRRQFVLMGAKRFPNQTLYAIATDGSTDDLGSDRKAKARRGQGIGPYDQGEHRISVSATLLVRAIEVRFAT